MSEPIKILLVEDSRFLRTAAANVLETQGFQVFTASDGEQALKIAADSQIDIILLDMILPKMQGMDVLKALRQEPATASTPVIVFSSITNTPDLSAYAPVNFLSKDNLMLNSLPDRIREHMKVTYTAEPVDISVAPTATA